MKKSIIALTLSLALCLSLAGGVAFAWDHSGSHTNHGSHGTHNGHNGHNHYNHYNHNNHNHSW